MLEKETTNKERGKATMNLVVLDWGLSYQYRVIVYSLHTHTESERERKGGKLTPKIDVNVYLCVNW